MKKYFMVYLSGNFSYAYNWDGGLNVNSAEEITIDDIKDLNEMKRTFGTGYWINNRRFDYKNPEFTPIQVYDGNSHGGSRSFQVIVVAKNAKRAKAIAQKWADKNWKRY